MLCPFYFINILILFLLSNFSISVASLVTMGRGRGRPKYKGHSRHFTSREELEEDRKKDEEKARKVTGLFNLYLVVFVIIHLIYHAVDNE